MATHKEIQPKYIWHKDKEQVLKDFILTHAQKQSPQRLLRNKLLAIQYQIEDYIESNEVKKKLLVLDFVKIILHYEIK